MVIVRRRKENRRRGVAAVEAALVLPILLVVVFGAIRYGWFFLKLQEITNAARFGARTAIRYRSTYDDQLHSDVVAIISTLLGPDGARIIGEAETPPVTFYVNGVSSDDIGLAGSQDKITVTIKVPAADVDIMPLGVFYKIVDPDPFILGASVTMSKEGV